MPKAAGSPAGLPGPVGFGRIGASPMAMARGHDHCPYGPIEAPAIAMGDMAISVASGELVSAWPSIRTRRAGWPKL